MAMTINMNRDGDTLTVGLEGRPDTTTAPELESELRPALKDGVTELIIDLKALDYVSSAGLRVLLSAQKIMNKQGGNGRAQRQRRRDGSFRGDGLCRPAEHRVSGVPPTTSEGRTDAVSYCYEDGQNILTVRRKL